MSNFLCTREAVKNVGNINGTNKNAAIDRAIEAMSRLIERETRRYFIPRTETRYFRWPPQQSSRSYVLWTDQDLLSVTTLQTQAQDDSPTTITSADYFLEPINSGRYNRIEIDLSSNSAFEGGDTPQRSISVLGSWGYSNNTRSGGTVASGLASDSSATSFVCSNESLIEVGHTLLIESEQIFVKNKTATILTSILLNGALTALQNNVTVTVDASHGLQAGEVILVDSERMYIESVSTNDLTVIRAYDGSTLADHNDDTQIYTFRTLTIERGNNGTTAATHANATAISVYEPEFDISEHCLALTLARIAQGEAMWGRSVGTGEGAREFNARNLQAIHKEIIAHYKRHRSGVV